MPSFDNGSGFIASGSWSPVPNNAYFPDPFMDMASLALPETITYALRWCWLPDTLIELANFEFKAIQDICAGDVVRTKLNTFEPVVATSVRNVTEEIIELAVAGLGTTLPLKLTQNHKLIVRNPDTCEQKEIVAGDLKPGDWLCAPRLKVIDKEQQPYNGWLLGMYLAEGCGLYSEKLETLIGTRFTLGYDDTKTGVLQALLDSCKKNTGKEQKSYVPPNRPDLRLISVHDGWLAGWLQDMGGEYAHSKRLTDLIYKSGEEFALAVLAGWLDGDGNLTFNTDKLRGLAGSTISKKLAFQFMTLTTALGMRPALIRRKNLNYNKLGKSRYDAYYFNLNRDDAVRLLPYSKKLQYYVAKYGAIKPQHHTNKDVILDEKFIYRKVTSVTRKDYKGPVYNFEVHNEHSYIANTISSLNCEYLMYANGTYFRALDRVLSYFITDIEVADVEDDDEKKKINEYLHNPDGVDILNEIHIGGLNYMVYGQDFCSVLMPFRRYLSCPQCGLELPLKHVYNGADFAFKWTDFEFHATCPKCKFCGAWNHIDRRSGELGPIRIKHWSPHEMELLWDPYTDDVAFIWKIPEEYRQMIKKGHLYHLERANWEIIQCVKNNTHLRFDKDAIYHMKESTLAGVRNRGWGISRVLSNFRQAWYVQVLHRYNEAIALDYVIPFRLITPAPGPGSADQARDALLNLNMGGYMSQIQRMIRDRRRDPASWHTLPFAVQYQALGGDATQLAPRDLIDQGLEILLNNVGVPVELYKGSLQIQSAPAALRLFESSWSHLVHNLNGYINYIMRRLGQLLSWDKATAKLVKVTHADDLNRQMAKLQLMMGGQVSKQTGLGSVGIEYYDEVKRQLSEQKYEAEEQEKLTKDMDHQATMQQMAMPPQQGGGAPAPGGDPSQGGGAAAGGAPPAGPAGQAAGQVAAGMPTLPNKPTTPQEMLSKAQQLAQQILSMPESQKDSELIQLKRSDPTMHSLVTSQLKDIRQQAQTQGGAMLMQQQFGKQGSVLEE